MADIANGYDVVAAEFARRRNGSTIGAATVKRWAEGLPSGAAVLDVACGTGIPISRALVEAGCRLHALDASPAMIELFRQNFPGVPALAEPIETSGCFARQFDGVVAWGLLFLLSAESQPAVIARLGAALRPGGRLLFTAPSQQVEWVDVLTRRPSYSLGRDGYVAALEAAGLRLVAEYEDEGENHYFDAVLST